MFGLMFLLNGRALIGVEFQRNSANSHRRSWSSLESIQDPANPSVKFVYPHSITACRSESASKWHQSRFQSYDLWIMGPHRFHCGVWNKHSMKWAISGKYTRSSINRTTPTSTHTQKDRRVGQVVRGQLVWKGYGYDGCEPWLEHVNQFLHPIQREDNKQSSSQNVFS